MTPNTIKPSVKRGWYAVNLQNSNWVWSHQAVQRLANAIGIKPGIVDVKVYWHRFSVDPSVGSSTSLNDSFHARRGFKRIFNHRLNGWPVLLTLPTHKWLAIVFD